MNLPIRQIKPKKLSDQVFDQIRELIFRERLKPGEKLMPERELAEAMAVSRTSIRDAIQRLVAMGLVEQKQGQGTFVKKRGAPSESNPLARAMKEQDASLGDLLEVRMALESNAASLAAVRADENDLNAMAQSLDEMEAEIASGRLGTEADTSFHMAVAYGAKNPLHILIMRNFYDYLFQGIKESLECLYEVPENIEAILKQHNDIFKAIKSRDSDSAYNSMKKHINFVLEFFKNRREKGN